MSFLCMMMILGSAMANMITLGMVRIFAKPCGACDPPKDASSLEFGTI